MDARFVTWPAVDAGEMAGVGVTSVRRPRKRQTRGRRQHRKHRKVDGIGVKRTPEQCAHCGNHFWARARQVFCGHSCRTLNNRIKRELAPVVLVAVFGMPIYKAEEQLEVFGLAKVSRLLGKFRWAWDARAKEWRQE